MYELLDEHRALEPKCLENFKNLNDLMKRFEVRRLQCSSDTISATYTLYFLKYILQSYSVTLASFPEPPCQ